MKLRLWSAIAFFGLLALTPSTYAQYTGENIRGDYGVNSGTQGPPGIYVIIPYFQQNADRLKDNNGDLALPGVFQGFDLRLAIPTIYGVTSKKFLGGNYGFTIAPPFTAFVPERASAQTPENHWAISDIYVAPLNLGWSKSRADFIVGYAFNAPTGKYEVGASDNTGLGMWSHEIQGGTTVYLDKEKKYTVATFGISRIAYEEKGSGYQGG